MRAYAGQVRTELTLSLRQGEQLLVSVAIPWLLLVFFSLVDVLPKPAGTHHAVDFLAPGILALAVMSTAMVSLGIGTGFERQYGVLKRLGVDPARPAPADRGQGRRWCSCLEVGQVIILVPTALVLGWNPSGNAGPGRAGLRARHRRLRRHRAAHGRDACKATLTLAAANGLYLVLLLLGGMIIPLTKLPAAIRFVAELLPAAALSQVMNAAFTAGAHAGAKAWIVLFVWAVAAPVAAALTFRWE